MATDWVQIGSDKLVFARKKLHLSKSEVRDRLKNNGCRISVRTYERWEKGGQVPREWLPAVANVLGLDLGQILADQPSRVQWQQVSDVLAQVVAALKVLNNAAAQIEARESRLDRLLEQQASLVSEMRAFVIAMRRREAAS